MHPTSLILIAILAQAAPSIGESQNKAQAKTLLGLGTRLYEQGDVAGALEKFQAAYAAFPSPKLMFNIGEANRDLHRPVEALEAFEKFLAGATDAPTQKVADVRMAMAQLQKQLGQIQVDCMTSGSEVSVDGKRVGITPLLGPIWATPGHHQVAAKHESVAPAIEEVDVKAGEVRNVTLRLVAPRREYSAYPATMQAQASPVTSQPVGVDVTAPAPAREDRTNTPFYGTWWFWTGAGAAVVAGTVTAIVLANGGSKSNTASTDLGTRPVFQ